MKNIIFSVSLLIATAAAGYLGYQYLQIKQVSQASQAVDGCMNNARFVYEDSQPGNQLTHGDRRHLQSVFRI